jgi:hypothetical protein
MATPKKSAGISKHKPAAKKPPGEAFDIIPASKVKPAPTSRPVITSNGPEQTDNTLAQPSTAPMMHRELKLTPLSGQEDAARPDAAVEAGAEPGDTPTVPAGGRSLADILSAKKKADAAAKAETETPAADGADTDSEAEDETEDKVEAKVEAKPAADVTPVLSGTSAPAKPVETEKKPEAKPEPEEKPKEASSFDSDGSLGDLQGLKKPGEEEAKPKPVLYGGKSVIRIEEAHPVGDAFKTIFVILLVLALAAAAVNFLLDAGIIALDGIPHTNLLEP